MAEGSRSGTHSGGKGLDFVIAGAEVLAEGTRAGSGRFGRVQHLSGLRAGSFGQLDMMASATAGPTVVLKIGTSTIVRDGAMGDSAADDVSSRAAAGLKASEGELAVSNLAMVIDTLLTLKRRGCSVVLVTSGAVGVGCKYLGAQRPTALPAKQAMAAVGQQVLMRTYDDLFRLANQPIAQILLTRTDFSIRAQYENAKNCVTELLNLGVVPIINENDTVATEQLRFGDNDSLSAFVANLIEARWLFLLTDVDHLYTANPREDPTARPLKVVKDINELEVDVRQKPGSQWGTGGMATKLTASRLAIAFGTKVCICNGKHPGRVLDFVFDNKEAQVGTVFLPGEKPVFGGRKRWLSVLHPRGVIKVDEGAARALANANSLLAAGAVDCIGNFERDSLVQVIGLDGNELARGLVDFSADEARLILGKKSHEIPEILGRPSMSELIHRENLILTSKKEDS